VAAPRSDLDQAPPQGPRSQGCQDGILLTEAQIVALEKAKAAKEAHGEFDSECPGYCGAQDTYYVGTLKGVGRVYQQTVIDTYAKVAFAKLYDRKTPITAGEILNDRVVPFCDEHGIRLSRMLTDRGTEFCGTQSHEYELYLAVEDIDHSRTKTKSPQTNGSCERARGMLVEAGWAAARSPGPLCSFFLRLQSRRGQTSLPSRQRASLLS
jgi:transposase InsO family protein